MERVFYAYRDVGQKIAPAFSALPPSMAVVLRDRRDAKERCCLCASQYDYLSRSSYRGMGRSEYISVGIAWSNCQGMKRNGYLDINILRDVTKYIMPAKHHINDELKIITTTWEGEASEPTLIAALKSYKTTIKDKPEYHGYNEIIEFTQSTNFDLSIADLQNIAKVASKTDDERISSKLAFIVASIRGHSLARVYGAYRALSDNYNKELRVFNEKCDALQWIKYGV